MRPNQAGERSHRRRLLAQYLTGHLSPAKLIAYSIVAHSKESRMTIVADTTATIIPTGTWSIDPVWSALEFEVKKIGLVAIKGRALGFSGTIRGGADAAIDGVVDARTITTFDE